MKSLIAVLCLVAMPSYAQTCRGTYFLGETVPPACQRDHRAGAPVYQRWDKDHMATGSSTDPEPKRPAFNSIYNSRIYGFGR
jgi:hypothetical protein